MWEAHDWDERENERRVAERHEQTRCDKEPSTEISLLRDTCVLRVGCLFPNGFRGISCGLDLLQHPLNRNCSRKHDPGPFGREIDLGSYALQTVQPSFDPSCAGATGHPADDDGDLGHRRCRTFGELRQSHDREFIIHG